MNAQHIDSTIRDFFTYIKGPGMINLYNNIYQVSQFPIFSIAQICWSCYAISRSTRTEEKFNVLLLLKKFAIAFLMSFLPRELFALVIREKSPLLRNIQLLPFFIVIFGVFQMQSLNKLTDLLAPILGVIQGVNQARFYASIIRRSLYFTRSMNHYLILGLTLLVLDHLIKFLLGDLMCRFNYTEMASLQQSFRISLVCTIMYVSTNKTPLSKYFAQYSGKVPSLVLVFILGLFGFAAALPEEVKPRKVKKPESDNQGSEKPKITEVEPETQNKEKTE